MRPRILPGDPSMSDPEFVATRKGFPTPCDAGNLAADRSSIEAFQASQRRAKHGAFPDSEVRETIAVLPDGRLGQYKASTREIEPRDWQGPNQARLFQYPGAGARVHRLSVAARRSSRFVDHVRQRYRIPACERR